MNLIQNIIHLQFKIQSNRFASFFNCFYIEFRALNFISNSLSFRRIYWFYLYEYESEYVRIRCVLELFSSLHVHSISFLPFLPFQSLRANAVRLHFLSFSSLLVVLNRFLNITYIPYVLYITALSIVKFSSVLCSFLFSSMRFISAFSTRTWQLEFTRIQPLIFHFISFHFSWHHFILT